MESDLLARLDDPLVQALFEASVTPMAILDRDFNFVRVNRHYAAADDREPEFFTGRNHFELYPSDYQPIFEQVVRTGKPHLTRAGAFAYDHRPERGTTYWDWTLTPLLDEAGRVQYLVFLLVDVTERVHTEYELREDQRKLEKLVASRTSELANVNALVAAERTRLQAILDTVPIGLVFGDREARLTLYNQRALEIYSRPVPVGQAVETHAQLQLLTPDGVPIAPEDLPFTRSARDGVPHSDVEMVIALPDGTHRHIVANTSPVRDDAGQVTGVVGAFHDITRMKQIEEELREHRDNLEHLVGKRTRELRALNEKLQAEIRERQQVEETLLVYRERLRALASELVLAEEREHRRIATDVHDHLAQDLAFTKMKLMQLRQATDSQTATEGLSSIQGMIDNALVYTRRLMLRLSPPVLYELGLIASLEWLADRMESDHKIRVRLSIEGETGEISHDLQVTLFRAVSELLNNVAKHAKATEAVIRVYRRDDSLTLEVEDDGRGLQSPTDEVAADTTGGFGLFSLQERLSSLGGSLDITSQPGVGTRVTVQVPCV